MCIYLYQQLPKSSLKILADQISAKIQQRASLSNNVHNSYHTINSIFWKNNLSSINILKYLAYPANKKDEHIIPIWLFNIAILAPPIGKHILCCLLFPIFTSPVYIDVITRILSQSAVTLFRETCIYNAGSFDIIWSVSKKRSRTAQLGKQVNVSSSDTASRHRIPGCWSSNILKTADPVSCLELRAGQVQL